MGKGFCCFQRVHSCLMSDQVCKLMPQTQNADKLISMQRHSQYRCFPCGVGMSRTFAPRMMMTDDLIFVSKFAPASKENPLAVHEECTFILILEMLQAPACQTTMVPDWACVELWTQIYSIQCWAACALPTMLSESDAV